MFLEPDSRVQVSRFAETGVVRNARTVEGVSHRVERQRSTYPHDSTAKWQRLPHYLRVPRRRVSLQSSSCTCSVFLNLFDLESKSDHEDVQLTYVYQTSCEAQLRIDPEAQTS